MEDIYILLKASNISNVTKKEVLHFVEPDQKLVIKIKINTYIFVHIFVIFLMSVYVFQGVYSYTFAKCYTFYNLYYDYWDLITKLYEVKHSPFEDFLRNGSQF